MPFQASQRGKPCGGPRQADALRIRLERMGQERNEHGITRDEALVQVLFGQAAAGDVRAMRLILEFGLGRAPATGANARRQSVRLRGARVEVYLDVSSPSGWPRDAA